MIPVLLAPFGEGLRVGVVGSRVEHPGVGAVAGDALSFEVGNVLGQRRRTKADAVVAHATLPEGPASVTGLFRSPHHLANETLRSPGAPVAVTDAPGLRVEVVVP